MAIGNRPFTSQQENEAIQSLTAGGRIVDRLYALATLDFGSVAANAAGSGSDVKALITTRSSNHSWSQSSWRWKGPMRPGEWIGRRRNRG